MMSLSPLPSPEDASPASPHALSHPLSPVHSAYQLRTDLRRLLHGASLLTDLADELEAIMLLKDASRSLSRDSPIVPPRISAMCQTLEGENRSLTSLESSALEAATNVQHSVESMLVSLVPISRGTCSWEEAASIARISTKQLKTARNRKWRQRRRQHAAKSLQKERERYNLADQEVDEWRAREIAKDIAKRKMEKMKEVAKQKAKEEKWKLEQELELVLIIEKLQELRCLRIQRLKKQGCFLPEEDNSFMERVRAAVEEEERQAAAVADTCATVTAIANAEEAARVRASVLKVVREKSDEDLIDHIKESNKDLNIAPEGAINREATMNASSQDGSLPAEFHHYYHGSNADMGTLIEVRRMWDKFLFPGGSRIPGHWVDPAIPSDAVWASCLVNNCDITSSKKI